MSLRTALDVDETKCSGLWIGKQNPSKIKLPKILIVGLTVGEEVTYYLQFHTPQKIVQV